MNIGWLKIIGATLFELVWVTGLKYAEVGCNSIIYFRF